jgi:hypothetical protein
MDNTIMRRKLDSSTFLQGLGQLVVGFGFMETAIRSTIILLARDLVVAKALVPAGNSVTQNLELLRRVAIQKVSGAALDHWLSAIDDLKALFEERNRIFHGMFYEDEGCLLLSRLKKGRGARFDEVANLEIEDEFIPLIHQRLNDRRRQFMDFCDDYHASEEGPAHPPSQGAHPSLSYGR